MTAISWRRWRTGLGDSVQPPPFKSLKELKLLEGLKELKPLRPLFVSPGHVFPLVRFSFKGSSKRTAGSCNGTAVSDVGILELAIREKT